MKKEKKCPKCNAPYSNFSLKIWKEKITDSLFCEECDKEEMEKAINSEWARCQQAIADADYYTSASGFGFHGTHRKNSTHSKYIRKK